MSPTIELCCKRLRNVPSRTLLVPHISRKPSMATWPAATRTVLCSLHAYEKMLDLLSVGCSLSLQSFNIFVKRAGSHSVPTITVSNHHVPIWASCEELSERESDAIADSPIDHHCNEWEQVKDDGIGIGKIARWVSSLLFCPEPNGQKFVAWNQRHRRHPGGKVRQPKLLRMIKWYKMAQPCCNTLNQFDGNSSVRRIPNEQQQKRPEALQLFESAWWHFQKSGPVGFSLRWTEIVF